MSRQVAAVLSLCVVLGSAAGGPPRPYYGSFVHGPPPPPPPPPYYGSLVPPHTHIEQNPAPHFHVPPPPQPVFPPHTHEEYPPASYSYNYVVVDKKAGVDFAAAESREGHHTRGSYEVLLPDGRRQIVTYVDNGDGFVAEVIYKGEAKVGAAPAAPAAAAAAAPPPAGSSPKPANPPKP